MSRHPFPVRSTTRPAADLVTRRTEPSALGYVDPFAVDQQKRFKVSLGACCCNAMDGLFDNIPLFTIPGTDFVVTKKVATVAVAGVGALVLLRYLKR